MAGWQVRVGLVDADRDAERTGAVAALAVDVAGIAIGTGDDPAAADVGPWVVDAYDLQLDVAVRSYRSAAGNQPCLLTVKGRNGCGCQQRERCTHIHEEYPRPLAHIGLPLRCAYSRRQITLRGGSTTSCWAALGRTR